MKMDELRSIEHREWAGPHESIVQEIARSLAESATLADAAPSMLAAVCRTLGWEHGSLWDVDRAGRRLRWAGTWHDQSLAFSAFVEGSRTMVFERGFGLPGRVWDTARPAWITNIALDSNFPRAAAAQQVGLCSAVALPIMRGRDVLGVMEFFSRDIREPDSATID